jgi:hypothetical protein
MAAWGLNCAICDQRLTKFGIEDTLESYFFPQKPDFPEGGKTFECPNCGYKGTYERTDLVYMHSCLGSILSLQNRWNQFVI